MALVDKALFPTDKACGDLVGPRGVQLLDDLGVKVPGTRHVGDMIVVGPTGRRVRLPCRPGITYPGYGFASPRAVFDETLQAEAETAGADFLGRAGEPLWRDGSWTGSNCPAGPVCSPTSSSAPTARRVGGRRRRPRRPARVLWGFALRAYVDDPVTMPHIAYGGRSPGGAFPATDGCSPVSMAGPTSAWVSGCCPIGGAGAAASQQFGAFAGHLRRLGGLQTDMPSDAPQRGRLGGWLKLGMLGTVPARGGVLLVGDAAGLVNPLQGEGIAQAMGSGRAAAEALLAGPAGAAVRYRRFLADTYTPYASITDRSTRRCSRRRGRSPPWPRS